MTQKERHLEEIHRIRAEALAVIESMKAYGRLHKAGELLDHSEIDMAFHHLEIGFTLLARSLFPL